MKKNEPQKEFLEACISSGKYIGNILPEELPEETIIEIEDILIRYNDTSAKTKIRKILRNG